MFCSASACLFHPRLPFDFVSFHLLRVGRHFVIVHHWSKQPVLCRDGRTGWVRTSCLRSFLFANPSFFFYPLCLWIGFICSSPRYTLCKWHFVIHMCRHHAQSLDMQSLMAFHKFTFSAIWMISHTISSKNDPGFSSKGSESLKNESDSFKNKMTPLRKLLTVLWMTLTLLNDSIKNDGIKNETVSVKQDFKKKSDFVKND